MDRRARIAELDALLGALDAHPPSAELAARGSTW